MDKDSSSLRLVSTAILSCVFFLLAISLSAVLKPLSRQNPHVHPSEAIKNPSALQIQTRKQQKVITQVTPLTSEQRRQCYQTCQLDLVESLPENLTLTGIANPVRSTYESWKRLIRIAEKRITLAAYKSSLRGKHVLSEEHLYCAKPGDDIYNRLKRAGVERGIRLEAVENYPAKDRGDNEDVLALSKLGVLERRRLDVSRISASGIMHSKFMIADNKHFYLGSANFDWRSLNQKMELGVHVENCPCLAKDLRTIYDSYWASSIEANEKPETASFADLPVLTSKADPLMINIGGVDTEVHLAASPKRLMGNKRRWDLDAIISLIDEAKHQLDIHVMDYVPMYVYEKPRTFWPIIEYAIRRAVVERGVKVRFLTAALHFAAESLSALKALQSLNTALSGRVSVKILNIPAVTPSQRVFARERRTHRKLVISDDSLLIGTSNWSGDYFANTTGVAIVVRQPGTAGEMKRRPIIDQARQLFERDWSSAYANDLDVYMKYCYDKETGRDLCKVERMAYQRVISDDA